MKKIQDSRNSFGSFLIIATLSFIPISCDFYNFSQPQPFDKEKIYQFPEELLGKWLSPDTANQESELIASLVGKGGNDRERTNRETTNKSLLADETDSFFYCINRNHIIIVISEKKKILVGAWPRKDNKNEYIYPPKGFHEQDQINYDSLDNPIDTISRYVISKNKIYEKEEDRFLERGYDYLRIKDTITVLKKDSIYIDLGQNAFLRKLTDSLYVFNINNSVLALGEGENWWRLIIIELEGKGKFNQWVFNNKAGMLPCMFYERPSKFDQFYFDCQWNTSEVLGLIREGYFDKESVWYRENK